MAGRDRGRTDEGEATTGTGFRFDGATDDAAEPTTEAGDGSDPTGSTAVGADSGPAAGDDGGDERVRDERARAALNERLAAVERAVTGSDAGPADLSGAAAREERLEELTERLDDIESRVAELEGGLQAVRGYVGDLRAVNRDVERRAEAALAATREGGPRRGEDEQPRPEREPDAPEGRERPPEARNGTGDTDGSGRAGRRRCEHCGRAARAPGSREGEERDGSGTHRGDDPGAGDREPDDRATGDRTDHVRPGRESGSVDERTGIDQDGDPEPAPGMGAALDARADGYRPPAVDPTDEGSDEDGDGPLARLRDAL
ncbi:MAG: hypothetical protein ABEI11_00870 [Haloarculaceae archaeon]